jgi:hypothetical protein
VDEALVNPGRLGHAEVQPVLDDEDVLGEVGQEALVRLAPAAAVELAGGDRARRGLLERGLELAAFDIEPSMIALEAIQVLVAGHLLGGLIGGDTPINHRLGDHLPDEVVGRAELRPDPAFCDFRIGRCAARNAADEQFAGETMREHLGLVLRKYARHVASPWSVVPGRKGPCRAGLCWAGTSGGRGPSCLGSGSRIRGDKARSELGSRAGLRRRGVARARVG